MGKRLGGRVHDVRMGDIDPRGEDDQKTDELPTSREAAHFAPFRPRAEATKGGLSLHLPFAQLKEQNVD
ncbi:hypothetical protein Cni_G16127 [Canna indica]|uniref:Uncharacterized protein n=1 Tax=Canna indica TaxID=4628 RepID=A0AAQ3QCB1_9LILI|nr:hypothetical protein Cni_G16127 [Canna indica]